MSTLYDGDFSSARQHGPFIPTVDNETQSTLFTAEFMQRSVNFKRTAFGAQGPNGSRLVEESGFSNPGGPIIKWTRLYATKPPSRNEEESFTYGYQIGTDNGNVVEIPLTVKSRLQFDYFHTTDPEKIQLFKPYRLTSVGGTLYFIGDAPGSVNDGAQAEEIVAENSGLRRWKGNFWERKTRYVPKFDISLLT